MFQVLVHFGKLPFSQSSTMENPITDPHPYSVGKHQNPYEIIELDLPPMFSLTLIHTNTYVDTIS